MSDLRRFWRLLRAYVAPHRPAVAVLVVLSLLATAVAALLPVLMAPILDLALGVPAGGAGEPVSLGGLSLRNLGAAFFQWIGVESVGHPFRAILVLCAIYAVAGIVKSLLDFSSYLLFMWIRVRAMAAMQLNLFRHLIGLSMGFFTKQRTGDLVSRLHVDTQSATGGLEVIVGPLLTAPVLIAFYGVLLVRTSPTLVLAAVGAAALHWGVTRGISNPIRRASKDQFSIFGELASHFQEALLSVRVVKSFGAERFELQKLAALLKDVVRVNFKLGFSKYVDQPARALIGYVVEAAMLVLAAYELMAGHLSASTFILFLYVGRALVLQVGLLGSAYTQIQAVLGASNRVADLFEEQPAVQDGTETIDGFRDRIALRDVSFDYGGERVLDHVSLEIARGEIVALVGPSGGGKSTLADLVLRLYDPVEGTLTIDGRNLRTLRQEPYRRLFGVVPQEALLFNATIAENIAYGRDGLPHAEIERAARIANAHDFVAELPRGYATVVGDRGIRLSGGQRQRVAIARAIVASPAILILDEATSSLDSESERLVQQAIERVIEGTTSIVIAHRLSTVFRAHKIVVVNRGRVEAVGRHTELLATSETYNQLYRLQFTEAEAPA
jgi:subfamily B ATP-binding cassette protein MsbA